MKRLLSIAAALLALAGQPAVAREAQVSEHWVRGHEQFLAGDALAGRGSATHDEAVAAAYVAAQFQSFGLERAPSMSSYVQTGPVIRRRAIGTPTFEVDGTPVPGFTVMRAPGGASSGTVVVVKDITAPPPKAEAIVFTGAPMEALQNSRKLRDAGVKLLILPQSKEVDQLTKQMGGALDLPIWLESNPYRFPTAVVVLPAAAIAALKPGAAAELYVPYSEERTVTTNAIGYLPGRDPAAPLLLLTAHLDHLGVEHDGTIMPGANDDASGTVAVLELARVLAADKRPRRGILFVAYGGEELGRLGSIWFGAHLPVPIERIAANIEFEMIGAQDPKLPTGALMMTGSERSTMFETLKAHGARVTADPYPAFNFFRRSDNYSLALKGVVAHTLSGWATPPTYHSPTDTVANIDFGYMTQAIGSLVAPIRSIANSTVAPAWKPKGRPTE